MIKQYSNLTKSKHAPDVSENTSNAWQPSYNELTNKKKPGSWLHKSNLLIDSNEKYMATSLLIAIKCL